MKKYLAYYENEWPANIAELTAVENKPFVGYLKGEGVSYTVIPEPVVGPADNEIWYTSTDGEVITPDLIRTNCNIISNTYENGKGVIVLDSNVPANFEGNGYWFGGSVPAGTIYNVSTRLNSIQLPDCVTNISSASFYGCSSLTSIVIPNGVTEIGGRVFYGCSSLTSINIPDSVTSIGYEAFYDCSSLTSIVIPKSATSIELNAFEGCLITKDRFINNSSLDAEANNYWGASVYDYEMNGVFVRDNVAVKGDRDATSIVIPNSITSIGSGAFGGCSSLTSITIPNSVTSIGDAAFQFCTSLTSITIPNSVTSIGIMAFNSCYSLTSIAFEGTMEEWNKISKGDYWNVAVPATYVQCTDGQVAL